MYNGNCNWSGSDMYGWEWATRDAKGDFTQVIMSNSDNTYETGKKNSDGYWYEYDGIK